MYKSVIAPIVAVIVLALQALFGIEIPDEVVNEFVVALGNFIAVVLVVLGIFKNHKKDDKAK